MTKLSSLTIHTTTIKYREHEIEVRGISATDVMLAANDYGPHLALAFGKVMSGDRLDNDAVKKTLFSVSKEFPELVAAVIAMANDDYTAQAVRNVKRLPFSVQVELVEAIFNETFASEADVKKLMESLNKMLSAISGTLTDVTLPNLKTGIGASDAA